jgi:hypothetical protein
LRLVKCSNLGADVEIYCNVCVPEVTPTATVTENVTSTAAPTAVPTLLPTEVPPPSNTPDNPPPAPTSHPFCSQCGDGAWGIMEPCPDGQPAEFMWVTCRGLPIQCWLCPPGITSTLSPTITFEEDFYTPTPTSTLTPVVTYSATPVSTVAPPPGPFATPTPTPTLTETPELTPDPTQTQADEEIDEFDRVLITYDWRGTGQADLDSATTAFGETGGWPCGYGGSYVVYGGDSYDQDSFEDCSVYVGRAKLDGLWSNSCTIWCKAGWYSGNDPAGQGGCLLLVTYRGVTQSRYINPPAKGEECASSVVGQVTVYSNGSFSVG